MKVKIKDLNASMELGNKGVTFDVYDGTGKFLGDLRLGRGTIEWCKGKTKEGNGSKMNWEKFLKLFEDAPAKKKPAKKVAKKKAAV